MVDNGRIDRPFERDSGNTHRSDGPNPSPPTRPPGAEPPDGDPPADHEETPVAGEPQDAEEARDREAELETRAREAQERLLRVAADFENYRKRIEREKQEYVKFAHERILRDLLPIADNLRRAVQHARDIGESPVLLSGVELVVQEFEKVLERHGVTPIDCLGRPFDPMVHEALQTVEIEDAKPGLVVEEIQRGYLLNGRVLRPALVSVSASPEQTAPGIRLPVPDDIE